MSYNCIAIIVVYLLFLSPPLFSGRPRCCRRLHRCRVRLLRRRPYPYRRATRQAEPFSSLDIAYLSVHSCTRHCYCCCYVAILFNCIACFFLSPLDVPSFILCCLLYILYSAVSPAHC